MALRFPSCKELGSSDLPGGKALISQFPKKKKKLSKTVGKRTRKGIDANKCSMSHPGASFP